MEGKAFLKKKKKFYSYAINFQVSGFFNQTAKMIFNYVMKDIMD